MGDAMGEHGSTENQSCGRLFRCDSSTKVRFSAIFMLGVMSISIVDLATDGLASCKYACHLFKLSDEKR